VVEPVRLHDPQDRLGHHVPRGQVGQLVHALHERLAGRVDQHRALAPDRLADQRLLPAGGGAEPERGRVELDELQVGDHRAGPQRQRDAVAGGHGRVRGRGEHLAHPAGGQHDRAGQHRADAVRAALAEHVQAHPGGPAVGAAEQVEHQRVLDQRDAGVAGDRLLQRALHLGAGRVAAGVHDPVAVVAALPGQRQAAVRVGVEHRAALDQLAQPAGPSSTSTRTAASSQSPTPAASVSARCSAGESAGSSAAAIPP
jgi:hypothetical protein